MDLNVRPETYKTPKRKQRKSFMTLVLTVISWTWHFESTGNKSKNRLMILTNQKPFLQSRYTNTQHSYEKRLNITNHQENANQNYNKTPSCIH